MLTAGKGSALAESPEPAVAKSQLQKIPLLPVGCCLSAEVGSCLRHPDIWTELRQFRSSFMPGNCAHVCCCNQKAPSAALLQLLDGLAAEGDKSVLR